MKNTLLKSLTLTSIASISVANAVTTVGLAPTTNVLHDSISGATNSNIIDEIANPPNHGRADSFTLGTSSTGSFDITSVTLAKNGTQTFNNDSVIVFLAMGGATAWDNGTGHNTTDDGTDFLVDTGMSLQGQETFTLNGAITGANFITFEFSNAITVADDTEYTVGWVYYQGSGVDRLGYDENTDGGRLSVTTDPYGGASSRGISFSIQGTETIPEPSSTALLGLGGLALILRRRK